MKTLPEYVDEILHYMWDPIGVAGTPEARGEYDNYVPRVLSLLHAQESPEAQIVTYLTKIESEWIGLDRREDRAREISEVLVAYRNWFMERNENPR